MSMTRKDFAVVVEGLAQARRAASTLDAQVAIDNTCDFVATELGLNYPRFDKLAFVSRYNAYIMAVSYGRDLDPEATYAAFLVKGKTKTQFGIVSGASARYALWRSPTPGALEFQKLEA